MLGDLPPLKSKPSHREAPPAPTHARSSTGGDVTTPGYPEDARAVPSSEVFSGAVRYDSYTLVGDALRTGLSRAAIAASGNVAAQRASRLVVVAWIDRWAPPAQALASALEAMRMGGEVPFAQIFVLDAAAERERAWEAGVVSTPSVHFFWDGEPVVVRRPDWEDGYALVGAMSSDRLLEVIRHARACGDKGAAEAGQYVLSLDF